MEEESSSEDEDITTMPAIIDRKQFASTAPALPPLPPTPDMVIVKKNYDPKLGNYFIISGPDSYFRIFFNQSQKHLSSFIVCVTS